MTYSEWKDEIVSLLQSKYSWTKEEATEEVSFHFSDDFDVIHYDCGLTPLHIARCLQFNESFYDY